MKEMYEESLRLIKILKLKTEDEYNKLVKGDYRKSCVNRISFRLIT